MTQLEARLNELKIELPHAPAPLGAYTEAVQTGNLLFLSGTLPMSGGTTKYRGVIGKDLTASEGKDAARTAFLNALAAAQEHLGSLNRVSRVVKLTVWMVVAGDFKDHANVADGASELLVALFGMEKASTRMVAGVASLPAGVPVVTEVILEVEP